jgi:hypothetical protein
MLDGKTSPISGITEEAGSTVRDVEFPQVNEVAPLQSD